MFRSELIHQDMIDAPIERVFERLSDHESMSDWPGIGTVELIREGTPRNGLGAVRLVRLRGLALDEEVVRWDPPRGFDYKITKGLPVTHLGQVLLEDRGAQTAITWKVSMSSKVPFLAALVLSQLRRGLPGALAHVASGLAAEGMPSEPT